MRADGVQQGTHDKSDRHWSRWLHFLGQLNLHADPFLRGKSIETRHELLCGFVDATRNSAYSTPRGNRTKISAGTCRTAADAVAAAFRAARHPDPRNNEDGSVNQALIRQIKGCENNDPGTQHQQCIPFDVLMSMVSRKSSSPLMITFHQLIILAFFFALRSCEYLCVDNSHWKANTKSKARRTLPLQLSSFVFWKDHRILPHNSPVLHLADAVTIIFLFQKTNVRNEQVTNNKRNI
jgi:hypothetical protein